MTYVVIQDKSLQKYIDTNYNWTHNPGEARKFMTRTEAKRIMKHRDIDGYDVFIDERKKDI